MRAVLSEYYAPSQSDFNQLWATAEFSFDANVLLDVYRYTPGTSQQLRSVIEGLGDRVWITYQAALEYQRNWREASSAATKALQDAPELFEKALAEHANALKKFTDAGVADAVAKANAGIKQALEKSRDAHASVSPARIHDQLTALLDGRVGDPYGAEELNKKLGDADRRTKAQIPPGFMDIKKPENKFGDVILWFQLLDHAKATKKPIILVTGDAKEDWWWRSRGKTIGPQPELRKEMKVLANVDFYMYSPDQFLENAKQYLRVEVSAEAIKEAQAVQSQAQQAAIHVAPQAVLLENVRKALEHGSTPLGQAALSGSVDLSHTAAFRRQMAEMLGSQPSGMQGIIDGIRRAREQSDILRSVGFQSSFYRAYRENLEALARAKPTAHQALFEEIAAQQAAISAISQALPDDSVTDIEQECDSDSGTSQGEGGGAGGTEE